MIAGGSNSNDIGIIEPGSLPIYSLLLCRIELTYFIQGIQESLFVCLVWSSSQIPKQGSECFLDVVKDIYCCFFNLLPISLFKFNFLAFDSLGCREDESDYIHPETALGYY